MNNPILYVDPDGHLPKWWQWALSGLTLTVGIACCFIPVGKVFGVRLIVFGAFGLASNTMDAIGLERKTVSLISSWLSIVAGMALCFTTFSGFGAGLTSQLNRYLGMGYGKNIIYVRLGTNVSSALKSSAYIIKYLLW